jgi:DeoR/GlpR family transcriptional regulator of sugar metabolism
MKASSRERQSRLYDLILQRADLSTSELARGLKVSFATIRRDLAALESAPEPK